MDFDLSEEQRAIVDAARALLAQHAGPKRAVALQPDAAYDGPLHEALHAAGFLDVMGAEGAGPLEAALLIEQVARAAGVVSVGASALVLPGVGGQLPSGPVAVTDRQGTALVRFAQHASHLLVAAGDEARLVAVEPGEVPPVPSNFMFPMGRVASDLTRRGAPLGPGSGPRARACWRLSLAAELVGAMGAALDCTVEYVSQRRQFGVPIGSFQAVKHRLARCKVEVEGARWLTYEAAYHGAQPEAVATAASYAAAAARRVHRETQQLTGAVGFTREHDLHVWSMRLWALCLELGGEAAHRRALARQRWRLETGG